MTVSFFGHSQIRFIGDYEEKLFKLLEKEVGNNSVDFYLGGYGDFDTFAYSCCKKYKAIHQNATLIFVTPYITDEYQRNHLRYYKDLYDAIVYPEIEKVPLRFCISVRNKWMVERSDIVIFGITRNFGGAYKSYVYAKQKKKRIFNILDKDI